MKPNNCHLKRFPEKLHMMLGSISQNEEAIVSWMPDGRSFIVRNPQAFEERIQRRYFNQSTYRSFQRQLNLYGFRLIKSGLEEGAYCHEHFLRERVDLCCRLQRKKTDPKDHKHPPQSATIDPDGMGPSRTDTEMACTKQSSSVSDQPVARTGHRHCVEHTPEEVLLAPLCDSFLEGLGTGQRTSTKAPSLGDVAVCSELWLSLSALDDQPPSESSRLY